MVFLAVHTGQRKHAPDGTDRRAPGHGHGPGKFGVLFEQAFLQIEAEVAGLVIVESLGEFGKRILVDLAMANNTS